MEYTINRNPDFNSIEITFSERPSAAIRDALKALRFRWHSVKRVWYGYTTEEAARAAIEGKPVQKTDSKPARAEQKPTGTKQDHVKIYYNGLKIDGGKLIPCHYSIDNNHDGHESVTIYARGYTDLPRDLFDVKNDTDIYTDYFDDDSADVTPAHPLYKYIRYAAMKARARDERRHAEHLRESMNRPERWSGQHDMYKNDLATAEKRIAEFDAMTDPGQPTAEDLTEIDRQKQEAENARRQAEKEEEQRRREIYTARRVNGERLIEREQDAHPITDGAPVVMINWSEHPAFSRYQDDSLALSLPAAENILRELDAEQNETRDTENGVGWYFKTKFTISGTDESGEEYSYQGRYDLGDGDGGLIRHIRSWGEYKQRHDDHGHEIEPAEEPNDTLKFADFLQSFIA